MVRIQSGQQVVLAGFAGSFVAAVASALLMYIVMPPERAPTSALYAFTCAAVVAFPMTAFMAEMIRRNQVLADNLQYLIDHDRLTDVATRDSFFRTLDQADDLTGVVMMIDIDHFKQINDTHGHLVGDGVIRAVAQAVNANIRGPDIVARFGGEEFIAFVNCEGRDQGEQIAERMRRTVESIKILGDDDTTISPTVSIGVARLESFDDVDQVIKIADVALYDAKAKGRNRVETAMYPQRTATVVKSGRSAHIRKTARFAHG